jgi:hypothetical protein
MDDSWQPALEVHSHDGRCRLSLGGHVHGEGDTLQEAADDLVVRLLNTVLCFRASGFRISAELGPPDQRWLEFLWELGDVAGRGECIRPYVFGQVPRAA